MLPVISQKQRTDPSHAGSWSIENSLVLASMPGKINLTLSYQQKHFLIGFNLKLYAIMDCYMMLDPVSKTKKAMDN